MLKKQKNKSAEFVQALKKAFDPETYPATYKFLSNFDGYILARPSDKAYTFLVDYIARGEHYAYDGIKNRAVYVSKDLPKALAFKTAFLHVEIDETVKCVVSVHLASKNWGVDI